MSASPANPTSHPAPAPATRARHWLFLLLGAGIVLAADQLSKAWVLARLPLYTSVQPVPALAPYFQLTHSRNTGAAFGIFSGGGAVLLVLALLIAAYLVWSYARLPHGVPTARLATALVVGGALGNALDRVQHGAVIDFIHYQVPGLVSNVSNLADHAIVLGVALMLLASLRRAPTPPGPR